MKERTMATAPAEALPRWDLTPVFPGPDSTEFTQAFDELRERIAELEAACDRHGVGPDAKVAGEATAQAFEEVVERFNRAVELTRYLATCLTLLISVDSTDNRAQARLSELQAEGVRLEAVSARWSA